MLFASDAQVLRGESALRRADAIVEKVPEIRHQLQSYFGASAVADILLSRLWMGEESLHRIGDRACETGILKNSGWRFGVRGVYPWESLSENQRLVDRLITDSRSISFVERPQEERPI